MYYNMKNIFNSVWLLFWIVMAGKSQLLKDWELKLTFIQSKKDCLFLMAPNVATAVPEWLCKWIGMCHIIEFHIEIIKIWFFIKIQLDQIISVIY